MKCEGCSTVINDSNGFQCCHLQCNKKYCDLCINLDKKKTNLSTWKCPVCCARERKTGNSSTPIRSSSDSQNVTLRKKVSTQSTSTPPTPIITPVATSAVSEVSELTSEIRLLTQEILSLKDKLESATTSLDKCHKRLDELAETITKSETRINKLEKSERMVNSMLLTINKLQTEIDTQAQNNVRNEIEIIGVPEVRNESLMHTVMSAAKKIGIDLNTQDVDWAYRAGSARKTKPDSNSNLPRPIVFRLLRRTKRDEIIKAAQSRRNINCADFQLGDANKSVFINERLTNHTRLLFRESRTRSKEHGFTYCWIKNGFIYVRQQDGSPAQYIRNQDDLLRIFPTKMNYLESYLEMYKNKENLVMAGDFNINIISDDYNTLNTDYLCLNAEYGLLPAITSATRKDSILDHIFVKSNKPTKGIVCKSDISDHYITIVDIALTKTQKVHTSKREVIKRNFEAIKADLGQVDWSDIYNNEDVNSAVSLFVEIVSAIIAKHSTAAILSRSKFCMKPWITPGLLRCMRHRDKLHIKARKSPQNDCLQITYRRYRNFCNKLLHKLKTQYERKEICESQNDPKRLWKTLRDICNITNKEKKPNNLLNVTGSTNANRSLDICNNYFSNIGQKLASDVLNSLKHPGNDVMNERGKKWRNNVINSSSQHVNVSLLCWLSLRMILAHFEVFT
ncbi:hypothetical protein ACJJTC_011369 [Scirpophaga incertulas]